MKVLMVCLGNICRSPLAHGLMEDLCNEKGLNIEVDSAGTSGWHDGEAPDQRSIQVAKNHGIDISSQRSRQVVQDDFQYYDILFAMDRENFNNLQNLVMSSPGSEKITMFLGEGINGVKEVPDPYYGGGFEYVYNLIKLSCDQWIETWNDSGLLKK